jgi:integrase
MKIRRTQTPHGLRSWIDYSYRGGRYRPVLGYNLTPDQEQDALIQVLTAIHANVGGGEARGITFAAFAGKYLDVLRAKRLKAFDRPETILARHLIPFFNLRPLAALKLEDGVAYIAHRRAQEAADGTIQRECGVLLALLNYAVDNEDLDKNRLAKLDVPKGTKRERVAQGWELYRLYAASPIAVQDMLGAALLTTLRQAKLVEIHTSWRIDRADGAWLIPTAGSRLKGVPKELPLSLLAVIFLQRHQPRIRGRYFSQWCDGNSFKHRWLTVCEKAGVQDLTFHDLRHTAATWLQEAGVDYATIQTLLGHRVPGTTERYLHNWRPNLRAAVTLLEDRLRREFAEAAKDERVQGCGAVGLPVPAGAVESAR